MALVRRVHSSVLLPDDQGRARWGGEPFTGLAYRVDKEGIVRELQVFEEGVLTGLSDDWLDVGEGQRLDRAGLDLEDAYGPFLRGGAPVDGVVYFFGPGGACVQEEAYAAGQPTEAARREWYPSGAPKSLLRGAEGWAWFEDGRLRTKAVNGKTLLNLVEREGALAGIVVEDAGLLDMTTVQPKTLSKDLLLVGHGIDDRVLQTLRDETKLGAVPCLRLRDTAVGPEGIEIVASLPALREVWLVKNRSLGARQAEDLTARRPDCVVHYQEAGKKE